MPEELKEGVVEELTENTSIKEAFAIKLEKITKMKKCS